MAISYAMRRQAVAGGSDLLLPSNALSRIASSTVSSSQSERGGWARGDIVRRGAGPWREAATT